MSDLRKSGLKRSTLTSFGAALGVSLLSLTTPVMAQDTRPVVVELFTSQGCSSCPPADAFLGELAQRSDVIALAWHVDYWNYLGWNDPFSSEEATDRQRVYGRKMGLPYVYTPQMVVDGRHDERGFDRRGVKRRIEDVSEEHAANSPVQVRLTRAEAAITASLESEEVVRNATVLMVVFDRSHTTKVARGENAGRELTDYNIVRQLLDLGVYSGLREDFDIPIDAIGEGQGFALLVQSARQGPYLGAAQLLPGSS